MYNLVKEKKAQFVYSSIVQDVEMYTKENVKKFLTNVSDESLLSDLCGVWKDYKSSTKLICDLMMYLDNGYVVCKNLKPLKTKCLEIFRDFVVRHEDVRDRFRDVVLSQIRRDRSNEVIDRISLKTVLFMLHELSPETYRTEFEVPFLKDTREFYVTETNAILKESACSVYLEKALKRLREEDHRVSQYLNFHTLKPLREVMLDVLVKSRAKMLVEMKDSGCAEMLKNTQLEDLSRMYDLFSKVPDTLSLVRNCMKKELLSQGHSIIRDPECGKNPIHFISKVLKTREQYGNTIKRSFRGDKSFQRTLKEAFETFLNVNEKPARYLSAYVDLYMKGKIATDRSERRKFSICTTHHLDRVIEIFRYLRDRDVFENL